VLHLFGVPTFTPPESGAHVFLGDRPHQLLALMACRRDWVARAELAEWLWSERSGPAALSNLRKVLLLAQRVVGELQAPPIESRPGLLRWSPPSDLGEFERACDESRAGDALALWRMPLLQSIETGLSAAAVEWVEFERARLAARWRTQASARLVQLEGEPDEAAELAGQLLRADPCDEAALAALVRARLQQGRAGAALRELQDHRERVRAEFGVEPSLQVRALEEEVRRTPGAGVESAPVPLAGPAPELADFVGRRLELNQLRDWLLRERRPVVSLVGPGGVGKTRLARALLTSWVGESVPTAVWVPLSSVQDASELPLCLETALGLAPTGAASADAWAPVIARLARGPCLLVLDNGEQVEGLTDTTRRLLAAAPGVQVLNVSRRRLSLEGEWLLPLDGLPLPDADERDLALLRLNDAVDLFERRARTHAPSFDLVAQAGDVVRFVHAVEGLPLAVELGAALVRLLPVAEIEAEITGAAQAMPALDASFELSWRGLSAFERQALHALAVLPADVDRRWAEQVAQAPLPVLASLVDKSLVRADGRGRFGLHPLLRRWAARRCADEAMDAALAERHSAFVALQLERLSATAAAYPKVLVDTLRVEWGHVTAAWHRAVAARQGQFVGRVAPVLQRFFELRGGWDEGLAMFAAALPGFDGAESGDPGRARSRLLRAMAALEVRCARHAKAEDHARLGLRLALRMGQAELACGCLTTLGLSVFSRGRYAQARPIFEQAVRRSRALGDPARLDVALGNLAIAEMALGRFDVALALFGELVGRARDRGDSAALVVYLGNSGEAYRGRGEWASALAAHGEALALCDRHGIRSRRATKLLNIAAVHHAEGRLVEAACGLDEALSAAREGGDRSNEAGTLLERAALRVDTGDIDGAQTDLATALELAIALESDDLHLRCTAVFGELWHAKGDRDELDWTAWALAQPALYAVERAVLLRRLAKRGIDATRLQERARACGFADAMQPRDVVLQVGRQLKQSANRP
jgi:DNA-binding SARP family transcriptional activator/tetratricopeptide (TPR) repeat protein